MAEKQADQAGAVEGGRATPESPEAAPVPAKERPTFVCESCGPQKPVQEVYQCTLCTLSYCVNHIAPMAHYCFGALGKPQTIGVSGS